MSLFNLQDVQADTSLGMPDAKPVSEPSPLPAATPAGADNPPTAAPATTPAATTPPAAGDGVATPPAAPAAPANDAATVPPAATTPPAAPPAGDAPAPAPNEAERKAWEAELMKKYGVGSMEELDKRLNSATQQPETEEQKRERETKYEADLNHFAVTNKFMSKEDLVAYQTMNGRKPEDIALQQFSTAYRESNKEASEEEIRAQFREAYHLDSDNATLRAQGELAIKNIADKNNAPVLEKYNQAKALFDTRKEMEAKMPKFEAVVASAVESSIPARLELVKGETPETAIGIEIPASEKAEMLKQLTNDETFRHYLSFKDEKQAVQFIGEQVTNLLKLRQFDRILTTVKEAAYAQGLKAGSTTGAEQPFGLKHTPETVSVQNDQITDADDARTRTYFRT